MGASNTWTLVFLGSQGRRKAISLLLPSTSPLNPTHLYRGCLVYGQTRPLLQHPVQRRRSCDTACLVEQACVHDVLDYLIGDAAFAQIGKHPTVILIGFREGEGYRRVFFFLWQPDFRLLCRGVTGVSVVVEQEIHGFPEGHICIILQKGDGVAPFLLVVVKVPGTVFDNDVLGVFEKVPAALACTSYPKASARLGRSVNRAISISS